MTVPPPTPGDLPTPGLARRLAAFMYEGVLLFGVVMIAGLLYGVFTNQRHALQGQHGLQAFLFVVFGAYFTWFWSHGGQTLAMQTWHIRLVTQDGRGVGAGRALLRYLLAWLWFIPGLAAVWLAGLHSTGPVVAALVANVAAWALLSRLHPQRQYWHDAVAGTRLVTWRPPRRT